MAKQPGSPTGGSDDSASESRPISVSELLARRDAAIADEERAKRLTENRGRRRAGRDGAVSVSELTGEIPRITDAPKSETPKAQAPKTQAPKTQDATSSAPKSDTPSVWNSPDSASHFPRSSSPVPRRASDRRPLQDSADPAGASTGFDGGVYDAPPQTRDFSSAAIAERASRSTRDGRQANDDEHANAVTGIIPIVGDDDTDDGVRLVEADDVDVVELDSPPPTRTGRFADVIDDDFDAYRSFAEYDEKRATSKKRSDRRSGDKPKRKRGWFGRKASRDDRSAVASDSVASDSVESDTPADDDHLSGTPAAAAVVEETTVIGIVDDSRDPAPAARGFDDADALDDERSYGYSSFDSIREDADDNHRDAADHDTVEHGAAEHGAAEHDSAAREATSAFDVAETRTAEALESDSPETAGSDFTAFTEVDEDTAAPVADKTAADEETADSAAATLRTPASKASRSAKDSTSAAAKSDERPSGSDDDRSPAKAWLLVIGEAILGLAVGVGLFWGFTELWRWNVYFALVLAVLVIFGIVSFTHAVRHSRDLFTTLLALGVGLIVTIGPLVLLAT